MGAGSALTSRKLDGEQGGKAGEAAMMITGQVRPPLSILGRGCGQSQVLPPPRGRAPPEMSRGSSERSLGCCSPKWPGMARWGQERVCRSCASNLLSIDFQAQLFDTTNATFFFFFFNLNSVCVCVNMQQVVYYIPRLLFYYKLFL